MSGMGMTHKLKNHLKLTNDCGSNWKETHGCRGRGDGHLIQKRQQELQWYGGGKVEGTKNAELM